MNIKIDENYSIKSDLRNVMLVENKVVLEGENKGNPVDVVISYNSTIEHALKDYARVKTNSSEATTIADLLKDIEEIKITIEKTLKGI